MDPLSDHLRHTIETRLRERGVFGLAVCGFDADGIRFAGGVGYADLERAEPVGTRTVFRVASVSKLLTTTLLLTLVGRGEIELDRPVNEYLPRDLHVTDAQGAAATSTLRMLLSHTSGLPFGIRGAALRNPALSYVANGGRVGNLRDAVSGLRIVNEPGERIVYSNPGFNLAGHLAAVRLGVPFETAARDRVLAPLGMADAAFTPQRQGAGVATPYGTVIPPSVGTKPLKDVRLVATPMGGLTAHVEDLARFGQLVLGVGGVGGSQVVDRQLFAEAATLSARNHPDLEQGYGLGFKVRAWRGRRIIGHDGNMPGVASQLLVSPDDGVGVVVLTNGFALALPHEVASLALEELVGLTPEPVPGSPTAPPADRSTLEDFGRLVEGSYRLRDSTPPGLATQATEAFTRVRLTHEVDGRLRVDGNPGADGVAWLLPHRRVGSFRLAGHVDGGTSAVIEERPDGWHVWAGYGTHLHRRR